MVRSLAVLASLSLAAAASASELANLSPGDAAPAFSLPALDGSTVSLSDYAGKTVVLEWFNPGCPYVVYAHGEGPLRDQAQRTISDDVVWLAINSGAPGQQGHGRQANQDAVQTWSIPHPVLLDESGAVGRSYGARTTPGMVVVSPAGTIAYVGALDNAPTGNLEGDYVNYVDQAVSDLAAGNDVRLARTRSYGCSVKYGS